MAFPGLLECTELSIAKQRLHGADIPYDKQELFGATSSLTFFFLTFSLSVLLANWKPVYHQDIQQCKP
jgi:hypothetical protein